MEYLALIGGLFLLLFTGDLLVRGAVALANDLAIPPLLIGLTIVAFGTSAPELLIGIQSALAGLPEIALGNAVGSNIANVLLVLGIPAMIYPICCDQPAIRRNTLFMLLVSVLFIYLSFQGVLTFWMGFSLFLLVILFLIYAWVRARAGNGAVDQLAELEEIEGVPQENWKVAAFIILGLVGLPVGAHITVDAADAIARAWQVPDAVIGLTIVAFGTSLPELATTVMAAVRRHEGLAVGNVIGSNIFNILAVMGVTAMVADIPVPDGFLRFDLWVMLGSSALLLPFVLTRAKIGRVSGAGFTLAYLLYIYALASNAGLLG